MGETKHEREAGEAKQVLHDQVTSALMNVTSKEIEDVVIAYEPVWAISAFGGEIAKPDDAQKMIAYIRRQIAELYGDRTAKALRILS